MSKERGAIFKIRGLSKVGQIWKMKVVFYLWFCSKLSQWQGWWWWQKEDDIGVDDGDGGDDDVGGDEAGRAAPELLLQFVPTLYRPSHHQ